MTKAALLAEAGYRLVDSCRICRSRELDSVLSLGATPLANAFVQPARLSEPEPHFPLATVRCGRCGLLQLSIVVDPRLMFTDYLYASSASAPTLAQFDRLAQELTERFALRGELVVEVGSNDGVLLAPLRARGVKVIGVEPAANLAASANARGLETWIAFFGADLARRLVAEKGRVRAVIANNVLAHIDDLHEVLDALDLLLADDGVFVVEVPYLDDLIANVEYDTIYHEHLSYFALGPLETLAERAEMELFDVQRLPVHGGSVRVFFAHRGRFDPTPRLRELLHAEREGGLLGAERFREFAVRVGESRTALRELLGRLRSEGRSLAGHGASAKGSTLLNYCGIGPELISFIGDSTPLKQGLLTPGTHIPVRSESAITEERPDYTLLLAWNYADEIVRRHGRYLAAGGRFIYPIPVARIIG